MAAEPRSARADQIRIRAARDTTLYAEDGATSNGAGDYLFVGANGNRHARRALIAFDIAAALPAGTVINSATLRLYMSRTRSSAFSVALHRVTAVWGEAGSNASANEGMGAPALDGDATWTHRMWDGVPWSAEGADFEAAQSAATSIDMTEQYYSWSSPELTRDVRDWLADPSTSFGWILISPEEAGKTKRFTSRSGPSAARPELVIDYTPPSAPSGACCAPDSSCSIRLDPGTDCSGEYQGSDTVCTATTCPPPTGACCTPDVTAACAIETQVQCGSHGGRWRGPATSCEPADEHDGPPCPVVLERFVDPLPLPAVAGPAQGEAGGEARYEISMVELKQKLHRDLPETTVWGYSDGNGAIGYPGPTIEARSGEPVTVRWTNDLRGADGELREAHALAVDTCPHGATEGPPRTVVHLHGGHVASEFDGQPELTLAPGESTEYEYPNGQTAATLWYHDHALGVTRLNVYMGLAGFYLLRDDAEDALGLPSGKHEVALAIQDRSFHPDGSLRYPAMWQEHFFGETAMVNGKAFPYLEVERGKYRFRILNGSGSRTYRLRLSTGEAFRHIGGDGGLLSAPVLTGSIVVAPGERVDIVVDFANAPPNARITLQNDAPAPFPQGGSENALTEIMQFVVTSAAGFQGVVPDRLRNIEPLDPADAAMTRDFVLRRRTEAGGHDCGNAWAINDLGWHDITEQPHLGTTEVWRFVNRSGIMHPMHMHLVMFQVLDRQPFVIEGDDVLPEGEPIRAAPGERGWKDTVQVNPFEIVRVIARFEDFAGRFPYHCHILEHEDHEMMRQFEAMAVCGDGALARGFEDCDDGNTDDGDDCDSQCRDGAGPPPVDDEDAGDEPMPDAGIVDERDGDTRDGGTRRDGGDAGDERASESSGCGCRALGRAGLAPGAGVGGAVVLLLPVAWRMRRRSRKHAHRAGR